MLRLRNLTELDLSGNEIETFPEDMSALCSLQELILAETQALPAVELPFQKALQHTLAADVRAAEPVPGFRASIKARRCCCPCCRCCCWATSAADAF